ncbi:MAG: hypothetical protein ACXVJD_15210 [Mucilaginibacter sp.]
MTDTPEHIKQKQFEIWRAKPAMERLRLTLEDNSALFGLWNGIKKSNPKSNTGKAPGI